MASSTRHSIVVQGGLVRSEAKAGAAGILPGHLLEFNGGNVRKHATADGVNSRLVAVESTHVNPSTTPIIDVAYPNGDNVYYAEGQPGDEFYMLLANNQNAVKGVSRLVSNGDGTLKIAAAVDASLIAGAEVGVPAENLNNTSGAAVRLKVKIT